MSDTRYRKKPVVINAVQWFSKGHCPIWAQDKIIEYADKFCVETLEGLMKGNPGDWIIQGVRGEIYPCQPDIFAATYEPEPTPSSTASGDVVDMMHGQGTPCYYCKTPVDHLAGNPGKWPIVIPHNGKPEYHCSRCITAGMAERDRLRDALRNMLLIAKGYTAATHENIISAQIENAMKLLKPTTGDGDNGR